MITPLTVRQLMSSSLSRCPHGEAATFSLAVHARGARVMWARALNGEQNLCPCGNPITLARVNALNSEEMKTRRRCDGTHALQRAFSIIGVDVSPLPDAFRATFRKRLIRCATACRSARTPAVSNNGRGPAWPR